MSTKLKLEEPKNVLVFTTDEDFLSAEYTVTKKVIDKKTTVDEYTVLWWLTTIENGLPKVVGAMRTGVDTSEAPEDPEYPVLRIKMLCNYVGHVIATARKQETPEILLEDAVPREVIAGIHAKWHSQQLNGKEYEDAATILRDFLVDFKVKNVKKVLSAVLDAKVESA